MKLTKDQITVLTTVLSIGNWNLVVASWRLKSDRHLVVDELLRLAKKFNLTVTKSYIQSMRKVADEGEEYRDGEIVEFSTMPKALLKR